MKLREMMFSIYQNWYLYVVNILLLTLMEIFVTYNAGLSIQISLRERMISHLYENYELFNITDTLFDSEEFYMFRQDLTNLNNVAHFYNLAMENEDIYFLSAMNQPIGIYQRYSERFNLIEGKQAEDFPNVLTMILNQSVFDFFQLNLVDDVLFNWEEVEPLSEYIPIILGYDYVNDFHVGEIFEGLFYFRAVNFIVAGFLDANSSIFFQHNAEFYLDSYVIVPFPYRLIENDTLDSEDQFYFGILYTAMINGNVATGLSPLALDNLFESIANQTGFLNFMFRGQTTFSAQFSQMRSLVAANRTLLLQYSGFVIVFLMIIHFSIMYTIRKKRWHFRLLSIEFGYQKFKKIEKLVYGLPYILSYIIVLFYFYYNERYLLALSFIVAPIVFIFIKASSHFFE
ncbi:MAG: hypothetical protein FWG67_03975 [Defluviitaleaceae bacterium]|nr:hypothetical protein [Defluviitaleaceae bacterium]